MLTKSLFAASVGVLSIGLGGATAMAAPIYLDVNDAADPTLPLTADWNQLANPASGGVSDLVDIDGISTGISANVTDDFSGAGGTTGGGDWAANPRPWTVDGSSTDYFFLNPGNTGAITFSGLTVGGVYDFSAIGSRDAAAGSGQTRNGIYTLGGNAPDNFTTGVYDAYNDGWIGREVITWSGVSPDANGELILTVSTVGFSESSYAYINAIEIELVPEPGSASLFLAGAALACIRRTRLAV